MWAIALLMMALIFITGCAGRAANPRQRYNHLAIIATDKNCGFDAQTIPDFKQAPENNERTPAPGRRR